MHHRETVGGRGGQRHQAVEKPRARRRQANARPLRQETRGGRRVAGVAFVAKTDLADARPLGEAGHIGDRNARHAVDSPDVIELERIDEQMTAVSEIALSAAYMGSADRWLCYR